MKLIRQPIKELISKYQVTMRNADKYPNYYYFETLSECIEFLSQFSSPKTFRNITVKERCIENNVMIEYTLDIIRAI